MKKFLLLLFLSTAMYSSFSQNSNKKTYLIVRIEYDFDKPADTPFYKIVAEPGNPYAKEIYGLTSYNTGKRAVNNDGIYFSSKSETSKVFYNYFKNPTMALLFLSENNWELITIYNQVTSSYDTKTVSGENYPYTTVSSYPVYYFRKNIE